MQSFLSLCPSARWPAALQGAPAIEGSLFHFKCPQTPHFVEKNDFLGNFGQILSLSSLSNFSPKQIQTPSNTLDSHLFSTIFKVVFFHLIFLSLVPYLGFEVQGCKCSFLATIHTPFSLLLFLTFFCSIICFICFSQHVLSSQHVLIAFIACFLAYAMIYRFYIVGLAFLGQDMSTFHVCAQIHMILGSLPCLCLDLHAYVFFAMFFSQTYMLVLRSMSLYLDLCVYVLCVMLVCLDLCQLLCHVLLQPFLSLDISLSCFLALPVGCRSRFRGLGLHPHTQAYIKGFWIISFAC